ncbi:DEAD/DEAH box helicase [Psychroflexus sp. CAK57W]|uniref:DEAD/DEAH box helicase n=1 Tax=Psychroflexus curvus TaxID=2873595 RepID=UPI001CC924D7|nr:DEAD/DEAH box helicase [Psychroflexus curvus]MBZ9786651.1 DEAD/DEAH box helicase [Psychroflexus curvus]
MANSIKSQEEILQKLNIQTLNPMQAEAIPLIESKTNILLLSPTGTGKTLAFSLPLLTMLDPESPEVQALILVPSRELAIQIEQVIRSMGSGYKVNAVYGGRPVSKDKIEIKHNPAILIGTPGRILDHFNRDNFSKASIKTLVLDEFDKSLEVGFEEDMKSILSQLPSLSRRVLTSATQGVKIPNFVNLDKPTTVNYLDKKQNSKLSLRTVISPSQNKLNTLVELVQHLGNSQGIVFCNLRESIENVSAYLSQHHISHTCFSGMMEQKDRERALIKFRNGSAQLLVATDLASRGIDIPEMQFIIHFELPHHEEEFIHRNGRIARVDSKGTAYILKWEREPLPEFIGEVKSVDISKKTVLKPRHWETLFISGGRRDKISKGDIAGLFFKQGGLHQDQLGTIELKPDCAFVSVPSRLADTLVDKLNNSRLKTKKVRIRVLD